MHPRKRPGGSHAPALFAQFACPPGKGLPCPGGQGNQPGQAAGGAAPVQGGWIVVIAARPAGSGAQAR